MRNIHVRMATILVLVLAAAGCSNEAELAKARTEAAAAKAEAARARVEAEKAQAELAKLKDELAKKPVLKNQPAPEETPLAKQFLELKAFIKKVR